jgi:hypothetical protein
VVTETPVWNWSAGVEPNPACSQLDDPLGICDGGDDPGYARVECRGPPHGRKIPPCARKQRADARALIGPPGWARCPPVRSARNFSGLEAGLFINLRAPFSSALGFAPLPDSPEPILVLGSIGPHLVGVRQLLADALRSVYAAFLCIFVAALG